MNRTSSSMCLFCGHPDHMHRVVDAIDERVAAGEDKAEVLGDYGWTPQKLGAMRRRVREAESRGAAS